MLLYTCQPKSKTFSHLPLLDLYKRKLLDPSTKTSTKFGLLAFQVKIMHLDLTNLGRYILHFPKQLLSTFQVIAPEKGGKKYHRKQF